MKIFLTIFVSLAVSCNTNAGCGLLQAERDKLSGTSSARQVDTYESSLVARWEKIERSIQSRQVQSLNAAFIDLRDTISVSTKCGILHGTGVIDLRGRATCLSTSSPDKLLQEMNLSPKDLPQDWKARNKHWDRQYDTLLSELLEHLRRADKAALLSSARHLYATVSDTSYVSQAVGRMVEVDFSLCPLRVGGSLINEGTISAMGYSLKPELLPNYQCAFPLEKSSTNHDGINIKFASVGDLLTVASHLNGDNQSPPPMPPNSDISSNEIVLEREKCKFEGEVCISSEGEVSASVESCYGLGATLSSDGGGSLGIKDKDSGVGFSFSGP